MAKTRLPRNAERYHDGVSSAHTVKVPLWPYLVTPVSSAGLFVGTAAGHQMWADTPGWPAAGITLAGTALTALTWRAAAARGIVRQLTATVTCVAGSVWTLGATLSAPWSRPWLDMWLLGAPVASIAMATIRVLRDGSTHDTNPGGSLGEAVKSLKNATVGRASITGARATAPVVMEPGTAIAELAADRDSLASVLDVRPTAVRVIPDPDSARRGRVEVVPVDQLRTPPAWPGPSAPGRSIADAPIDLAVVEDGEILSLWLPGDHAKQRNSTHLAVVGMSGSGKTELLLNLCADVLTRTDADLIVTDSRKGEQLPEWLRKGAHRAELNAEAAEEFMEELPAVIADRAGKLGRAGHKQWVKGCGLPYMVVVMFEAARLVAGNATFVDVAESARSVGIALVVELQRASFDRMPTSARANIGSWICLGVQSETDAGMALSDTSLDAGAAPWEWKNERPGYLYAELAGTDRTRWAMPARSYFAVSGEQERADAIARYRQVGATQPQPNRPATVPAQRNDKEDVTNKERNDAYDATEPPDDVDPAQPISAPPGMPRLAFGTLREPPMGAQEARDWLRTYITDLNDAGTTTIRPSDLSDVLEKTGKSGSWVLKELRHLSTGSEAILQKTDRGVYKIRIPEPA